MSITSSHETEDAIREVSELLLCINADLHAMPAWKRRTAAGLERLTERRRLMAKLDALRDQQRRESRS
jgi:hypothetical protein